MACQDDLKGIKSCVDSAYKHYQIRMRIKPAPMLADHKKSVEKDMTYIIENVELGIVGVLVLVILREKFLLENIAVHPSVQGNGYGKALLQLAEKTAEELGFNSIELYTNEKMNESVTLYQRIGYKIFNRVHENGYNRVYMKKRLNT